MGYAFAFGGSPNVMLGTRFWASERFGANDLYPGVENYTNFNNVYKLNNQDPYINFFYNYMLAFLVTNIAASAFAERCRVPAYILFSIVMAGKFRSSIKTSSFLFFSFYRSCLSISFTLDVGCQWLAWSSRWCTSMFFCFSYKYNLSFSFIGLRW
jgi:hypothetical protein